jgi:hypothetical protein
MAALPKPTSMLVTYVQVNTFVKSIGPSASLGSMPMREYEFKEDKYPTADNDADAADVTVDVAEEELHKKLDAMKVNLCIADVYDQDDDADCLAAAKGMLDGWPTFGLLVRMNPITEATANFIGKTLPKVPGITWTTKTVVARLTGTFAITPSAYDAKDMHDENDGVATAAEEFECHTFVYAAEDDAIIAAAAAAAAGTKRKGACPDPIPFFVVEEDDPFCVRNDDGAWDDGDSRPRNAEVDEYTAYHAIIITKTEAEEEKAAAGPPAKKSKKK